MNIQRRGDGVMVFVMAIGFVVLLAIGAVIFLGFGVSRVESKPPVPVVSTGMAPAGGATTTGVPAGTTNPPEVTKP